MYVLMNERTTLTGLWRDNGSLHWNNDIPQPTWHHVHLVATQVTSQPSRTRHQAAAGSAQSNPRARRRWVCQNMVICMHLYVEIEMHIETEMHVEIGMDVDDVCRMVHLEVVRM